MKMKKIVAGLAFTVLLAASVAVAPLSVMSISTYAEETSEESISSEPEHAYTSGTESSDPESSDSESSDIESSDPESSDTESEILSSGKTDGGNVSYEVVTSADAGSSFADQAVAYDGTTNAVVDGDMSTWRIYLYISEDKLVDKTSAYVYIRNNNDPNSKIVKLTTNKAYKKLSNDIVAEEGYVFVVFVVENVTNTYDDFSFHYVSDLRYSSIYFE